MEAIPDYELFLILEPRSPKRPEIERLMAYIKEEAAAEEQRKVEAAELAERQRQQAAEAAERQKQQAAAAAERQRQQAAEAAERQRIAAENAAKEAAERRQRMMDELSASLQSAAGETRGLSAGNEDVLGYEGEFELE
jgi:type IV secretory pathway VirB10-like protein